MMVSASTALAPQTTYAPQKARADASEFPSLSATSDAPSAQARSGFDADELKTLDSLKARDREVRAHESAHQSVGGQYAGAASFTYQRGPDGAQYAVGGEVPITLSAINEDPQATIKKMRTVQSAAMAPAEPSGQDRAVAAQAMQIMLQAQTELALRSGRSNSSDGNRQDNSKATIRQADEGRGRYQTVSGLVSANGSAEPSRANGGVQSIA